MNAEARKYFVFVHFATTQCSLVYANSRGKQAYGSSDTKSVLLLLFGFYFCGVSKLKAKNLDVLDIV